MPKKKPYKKNSGKKKFASRKKLNRGKKPIQRKKPTDSKGPSGSPSAQIPQGVGPETASQSEVAPEIPDDAAEHGGESRGVR
jgi:hypothetical protein